MKGVKGGILFPPVKTKTKTKKDLDVGNLKVNAINRRAALAMRCIGCDHEDLRTFCGIMNLPTLACKSSHQFKNKTLEKATSKVMEESMSNGARV